MTFDKINCKLMTIVKSGDLDRKMEIKTHFKAKNVIGVTHENVG